MLPLHFTFLITRFKKYDINQKLWMKFYRIYTQLSDTVCTQGLKSKNCLKYNKLGTQNPWSGPGYFKRLMLPGCSHSQKNRSTQIFLFSVLYMKLLIVPPVFIACSIARIKQIKKHYWKLLNWKIYIEKHHM